MVQLVQLQKRTMALAGIVMLVYLIFHMLSNLTFFSPVAFTHFYDIYNLALIRWPVLVIVLLALLIHVKVAIRIRRINAKVRAVDNIKHDTVQIPAKLVTLSVAFLLFFIIVHILQTVTFDTTGVYQQVIALFQSGWMVLFYLAGLFVLAMHLSHSLTNVLQTLGKTSASCQYTVWSGTGLLAIGFAAIPLYIYFLMP